MPTSICFGSSTCEDLKENRYRAVAEDGIKRAGLYPEMMEYWVARDNPPLDECLARVAKSDVLVVVVAYRYGWVPEDQPTNDQKSITWLECEEAKRLGKDVLAFLVSEDYAWDDKLKEEFRVVDAIQQGKATPELLATVQRNVEKLTQFKSWLKDSGTVEFFTTPEDLRGKVAETLWQWRIEKGLIESPSTQSLPRDPTKYLLALHERTSNIDIRGLQARSDRAMQPISINDLYIPLTTSLADSDAGRKRDGKDPGEMLLRTARTELHEALKHRRLVIVGDPGSGKSTFLRRIAFVLCQEHLGEEPNAAEVQLGMTDSPLPVLIRIADLVEHRTSCRHQNRDDAPTTNEHPDWLQHYLANVNTAWDLDTQFFQQLFTGGNAIVLLDGLDEAPTAEERESVVAMIERAAQAFPQCRFVVTTRPAAYRGESVLPGFSQTQIDPLDAAAVQWFLDRWYSVLFPDSPQQAATHRDELLGAFGERMELRRLARTPVMLTAMAVVHWNENRLPEQRADLYRSIIHWLSRSRKRTAERASPDRCVELLKCLALAMQQRPDGRQVQVPRCWAAEQIAPWMGEVAAAERFLFEEELDSGIIVGRGNEVRFWHLTFQEYLAAAAIAGMPEQKQRDNLYHHANLYQPHWKEVILLLAGCLWQQGRPKVEDMFAAILDHLQRPAGNLDDVPLADQARCAGLLGGAAQDLAVYQYRPDNSRYGRLMDNVLGIFDAEKSKEIAIKVAIEAADALGRAGDPRLTMQRSADNWIMIPAGEFLMGAQKTDQSQSNYDEDAYDVESPVHRVSLEAYQIARYPVTVVEFQRFVVQGGYQDEEYWREGGYGEFSEPDNWEEQLQHPNRPVVNVNWYEAAAYAAWCDCRLPTEAEWERAARGTTARKYPWGDEPPNPSLANFSESNVGSPTPVGVYPRGATNDGIHDLSGNVFEWCYREDYENPLQVPSKEGRGVVLRGGCFDNDAQFVRAAFRYPYRPAVRFYFVGFRLART